MTNDPDPATSRQSTSAEPPARPAQPDAPSAGEEPRRSTPQAVADDFAGRDNTPAATAPSDLAPSSGSGAAGNGSGGPSWLSTVRARLGLQAPSTIRATLEYALKNSESGVDDFTASEREMLLRLLEFGQLRVDDVMVPRADIIAIDEAASLRDLLAIFHESGVSRIPVYNETLDDPRGMVHVKDLFSQLIAPTLAATAGDDKNASGAIKPDALQLDLKRSILEAKLRRQVLFVPPSMPAMNLLIRMQSTRIHMALVVDEYGGTDGIVTIEDLVEQIVGEIEDEHDEEELAYISEDAKQGVVALARAPVEDLEKHLGVSFLTPEEEDEVDTLGGLVFTLVGRVPSRGEIVRHPSGLEFEVLDADPRRIKKLRVHTAAFAPVHNGGGNGK